MLSKKQRITRKEFDEVYRAGARIHSPALQCIVQTSAMFHGAVVVSKKIYKKAVDRNRLRRQIYSILYQAKKGYPTLNTKTLICIVKPSVKQYTFKMLTEEIHTLLKKV
jgi:ribonuclease P protein component